MTESNSLSGQTETSAPLNDTLRVLLSHRSIRKFTDQPIAPELLEQLFRAGQSAATSSHVQATSVIRVRERAAREALVGLAGNQPYIAACAEFLVFCADMKRVFDACARRGVQAAAGMTEQFIIATVDTSLFAQNLVVAAESAGIGICYIGGVRNHPQEISDLLALPEHVYPVFGLCLGYAADDPEVKPRLPLSVIVKDDVYSDIGDAEGLDAFDRTMEAYYQSRSANRKQSSWSEQLGVLFTEKTRPHMREFLRRRGFDFK
jgi:nitroreductase